MPRPDLIAVDRPCGVVFRDVRGSMYAGVLPQDPVGLWDPVFVAEPTKVGGTGGGVVVVVMTTTTMMTMMIMMTMMMMMMMMMTMTMMMMTTVMREEKNSFRAGWSC
jgi:hypothetical protein